MTELSYVLCFSIRAHRSHQKQPPGALQRILSSSDFLRAPESEESTGWKYRFMQNDLGRCFADRSLFLILLTTPVQEKYLSLSLAGELS